MKQAFILGAGLGTRLQPLTGRVPKPLVPLFHRPLAEWTIAACEKVGIHRFAINTHHLPEVWETLKTDPQNDVTFFHEPVLLETGGGLKNIAEWIGDEPVLIHNGDIFSTLPIDQLIAAHKASGLPVTLAVRSTGPSRHIALNHIEDRVIDIRNRLGKSDGTHLFTGIYCVNPEFLHLIPADEKISVIPAFLELAKQGKLGAIVLDDGVWLDLGDRESYLQAHRELDLASAIHPTAKIAADAIIERSIIGPDAVIETGTVIRDSIVWPGGKVSVNSSLARCIVFSEKPVTGNHENVDL